MGLATCEAVEAADGLELVARVDPASRVELADVLGEVDVVVDFTRPDVALANIQACIAAGVQRSSHDGLRSVSRQASGGAKVLIAPNFAIGAVLLMQFSQQAAKYMPKVEIIELHHDQKLDAPSGTAARTARMISEAGGPADVPIHSVRLPGIIANQEVIFGEVGQTLTIRHDTTDRRSFMPGVVLAIRKVGSMDQDLVVGLEHLLELSRRGASVPCGRGGGIVAPARSPDRRWACDTEQRYVRPRSAPHRERHAVRRPVSGSRKLKPAVDEDAFVRLHHHVIEQGSDGVVACGTTGEASTLVDAEHLRVIRARGAEQARRHHGHRRSGSNDTAHAVYLTERATDSVPTRSSA